MKKAELIKSKLLQVARRKEIAVFIFFFVVFIAYVINLTGFLLEDDEGAYLYASWRVSLGESLYRDVPVAQMPLTFWLGGFLFKIIGPSLLGARLLAVFTALIGLAAMLSWVSRLFHSKAIGFIAAFLLAVYPIYFTQARFFRPDIFMMVFMLLGLWLREAAHSLDKPQKRNYLLCAAGVMFGISILFKPTSGIVIGLLAVFAWAKKERREDLLVVAPAALMVAITFLYYLIVYPEMFSLTFGQHTNYYADTTLLEHWVRLKFFYFYYFKHEYVLWVLAFAGMALYFFTNRKGDKGDKIEHLFFMLIVYTIFGFIFIKRQLYVRHFFYLAPFLILYSTYLAHRFGTMLEGVIAKEVAYILVVVLVMALMPLPLSEWFVRDSESQCMHNFITANTRANDPIFADYAYINFNNLRRGIRSSAYISQGAVRSGKLNSKRLLEEIEETKPMLIIIHERGEETLGYGSEVLHFEPSHLVELPDFESFKQKLLPNYLDVGLKTCGSRGFHVFQRIHRDN